MVIYISVLYFSFALNAILHPSTLCQNQVQSYEDHCGTARSTRGNIYFLACPPVMIGLKEVYQARFVG